MGYDKLVKRIAGRRAVFDFCVYERNKMIPKLQAMGIECVEVLGDLSDEDIEKTMLGPDSVLLTRDHEFAYRLGREKAIHLPAGKARRPTIGQKNRAQAEVERLKTIRTHESRPYTQMEFNILRGMRMCFGNIKHDYDIRRH
jgi:hypothetical protein